MDPYPKLSPAAAQAHARPAGMVVWFSLSLCLGLSGVLSACAPTVKLERSMATGVFATATAPVVTEVVIATVPAISSPTPAAPTATFSGDLSAGTQHYQDPSYAISFDYPAAWQPYTREEALSVGANVPDNLVKAVARPGTHYNIRMALSVETGGPDSFSEAQYRSYAAQLDQASPGMVANFHKISDQIITVGGVKALEYIFTYDPLLGTGLDEIRQVSVVSKGNAFTLSCGAPADVFETVNKDVFDLIIQSFKFE
jgi:hypothetical protein